MLLALRSPVGQLMQEERTGELCFLSGRRCFCLADVSRCTPCHVQQSGGKDPSAGTARTDGQLPWKT